MNLHGKPWRGLRNVAPNSAQVFTQVKEKLPITHVTLLKFLDKRYLSLHCAPGLSSHPEGVKCSSFWYINHLHPLSTKRRTRKGNKTWEEYSRELHPIEKQGHKINLINSNRNKWTKDRIINSQSISSSHFPISPIIALTKYLLIKGMDVGFVFCYCCSKIINAYGIDLST